MTNGEEIFGEDLTEKINDLLTENDWLDATVTIFNIYNNREYNIGF